MPKALLTQAFVRGAACREGPRKVDYFDKKCPGFLLEVRSSGGKTFYQRYRDRHGREHQFKIGPASVLTVPQARKKARAIVAEALLGSDPQAERQELRTIPTLSEFIRNTYLPFAKNTKRSWRTDDHHIAGYRNMSRMFGRSFRPGQSPLLISIHELHTLRAPIFDHRVSPV